MQNTVKWTMLLSCVGLLATTGCLADPYERPDGARDIISDEQLQEFEEAGMDVYGGNSPPSIAGTYFFGDPIIEYTTSENWPQPGTSWCHSHTTYHTTEDAERYTMSYEYTNCDGGGEGDAAYISGQGNCFSLYESGSGTFEGCYQEGISVFSACLADNGDFLEPRTASRTTYTEDSDECRTVVGEGRTTNTDEVVINFRERAPKVN